MTPDLSLTSSYRYALPPELIATHPAEKRDHSRLMVLHRTTQKIEHRFFKDLPEYLDAKDLLIANNTKVMKARLTGVRLLNRENEPEKEGGKIEMLLLEKKGENLWEGVFKSTGKQVQGFRFKVNHAQHEKIYGEIVQGSQQSLSGSVVVQFNQDPLLSGCGELPLPHYMNRHQVTTEDEERYQTIYSKSKPSGEGSAAAPTAGLHFTPSILETLKQKGAQWEEVNLQVGLGTFRPVKAEKISDHVMHEERYEVPKTVSEKIIQHKKIGGRILAVGTTSVRTLESAYDETLQQIKPGEGRTSIFIYPGARSFQVVDRLITNFHLPESTLLMLVSAFAGRDFVLKAYEEAVRERYRFFSYGDAMLIL